MRVVVFGTSSQFTIKPLERIQHQHQIVGIVESASRGSSFFYSLKKSFLKPISIIEGLLGRPSLYGFSVTHKIPYYYYTPPSKEDCLKFLITLKPDIAIVASFDYIFSSDLLQIPKFGFINIHPSLLPLYRGPNAWFWQVYDRQVQSGVTIHQIDEKVDMGDILLQASFPILPSIDPRILIQKSIDLGTELCCEALEQIEKGTVTFTPQNHLTSPRYARRLKSKENLFHWQKWSLEDTYHFLASTWLWYNPFRELKGPFTRISWRCTGFYPDKGNYSTGNISFDRKGFFFGHMEGKIRLSPIIHWQRMFLWVILVLAIVNLVWMKF